MTAAKLAELIAADAEADAAKNIPFSPLGVGTMHGETMAMIAALANICAAQQRQIDTLIQVHGT